MKSLKKIGIPIVVFFIISIAIEILFFNYAGIHNYFNANNKVTNYNMDTVQHNWQVVENQFVSGQDSNIIAGNLNRYIKEIKVEVKTDREINEARIFTTDHNNKVFNQENTFTIAFENNNAIIPINGFIENVRVDLTYESGIVLSELNMQVIPINIKINVLRVICLIVILSILFILINKMDLFFKANKGTLALFICIASIRGIFYAGLTSFSATTDSYTMLGVNGFDFFKGKLHETRVPIYPLVIDTMQIIFTEKLCFQIIVLLQILISFIALFYFYKALNYILKNKYFVYGITFMYGISPAIIGWDNVILTESLALSGSVFFIYLMLKYLNAPSVKTIAQSSVLILALIFLRPTFLILLPIFSVFLVVKFILDSSKQEKTIIKKGIIAPIVACVIVLGYALSFSAQFSVFSLSNTLLSQNIFKIVEKDYYKNSGNAQVIRKIDERIAQDNGEFINAIGVIYEDISKDKIQDFVSQTLSNNFPQVVEDNITTALNLMNLHFPGNSYYMPNKYNSNFIKDYAGQYYQVDSKWGTSVNLFLTGFANIITFAHVYFIILCGIISILYTMIKHKKVLWVECGLISIILLTVASAIIGTYAEFSRTAICVLPYTYMAIARAIDFVTKNNKHEV